MAKLSTAQRKAMPAKSFAGPGKSFPVNDKVHARLAIGAATRSENAGNITKPQAEHIKTVARKKLASPSHPQSHAEFEALGND